MGVRSTAAQIRAQTSRSIEREGLVFCPRCDRRVRGWLDRSNVHPRKSSKPDFGATTPRSVKQERRVSFAFAVAVLVRVLHNVRHWGGDSTCAKRAASGADVELF